MHSKLSRALLLLPALLLLSAPARAGIFDVAFGLKGAVGGNIWTKPDNSVTGDGLGFGDIGGGVGYGGGLYVETRIIKFIGLETGLYLDRSQIFRNVDIAVAFRGSVSTKEKFNHTDLRVPILLKGVLPLAILRISLGIGPELVIPLSADASITGGGQHKDLGAKKERSTNLALDLGFVINLPGPLEIPLGLRAAKNLSQAGDQAGRFVLSGTTVKAIRAQNSWDIRLMAGLGFDF